ncbi:hypothetical protein GIB67_006110 [Kingdonia uniflora]|uniref:Leucine-rich repeat-containing N-terminal plant-type domain-containing protein n=1 Tax=Kingdonia uniflora TaxID=39325 RepID=A0A7J7LPZ3_9MAGN|nr:hypothetical protein GIB67_006110 [Kingdonia uniflora]
MKIVNMSDNRYSREEIKILRNRTKKSKPQSGDHDGSPLPDDRDDHRQALLEFKSMFNGSSPPNQFLYFSDSLASWNTSSSCCDWDVVTCSTELPSSPVESLILNGIAASSSTKVLIPLFRIKSLKKLVISDNHMQGELPLKGFANLTRLVYLEMSDNLLNGSIPTELLQLRNLQHLDLDMNSLDGTLSSEVGSLVSLRYLGLGGNRFSGEIPMDIGNLTRLQELYLYTNQFSGRIPKSIGNLRELQILNLPYNSLSSDIPSEIGNLINLTDLNLAGNKLTGIIPSEVGLMKNLMGLNLQNNSLSSEIPIEIGNLYNLSDLYLNDNKLTGVIPTSIGNLVNLLRFTLYNNKLTGEIPKSTERLVNLRSFDVTNNFISGEFPLGLFEIEVLWDLFLGGNKFNWTNSAGMKPKASLRWLSLKSCGIVGSIPNWLANQTNLEVLDLSGNELEGMIPSWFSELCIAKVLLSDNRLRGSLPPRLFQSKCLELLDITNNSFIGELPDIISDESNIRYLFLRHNNFSGSLPKSMSRLQRLEVLDLSMNNFSGYQAPEMVGLWYVDLSSNKFSGDVGMSFGSSVDTLRLSKNNFSGPLPSNLINMTNLRYLELHSNKITGELPDFLSQITTLEILILRDNLLTGTNLHVLANLTKLRILDLSGNELMGNIPSAFGNFSGMVETSDSITDGSGEIGDASLRATVTTSGITLTWKSSTQTLPSKTLNIYSVLDLSRNHFSGKIPPSLGSLKGLKSLNFSRNKFSGEIPLSFGGLKGLESLDLSHNNLSGAIPKTLENLKELTKLDISNNELIGQIPVGGQMGTLNDADSYANNSGLCGIQIQVSCEESTEGGNEEIKEDDPWVSSVQSWCLLSDTGMGPTNANQRQQNPLPATSRLSVHDRLGSRANNPAPPLQIQQEPIVPPEQVNPQLPARVIGNFQQQEEQNWVKPRVSVQDRLSEATGEHNPQERRAPRRAVNSQQYVTQEQVDKRIKELFDAQIHAGRNSYTRLQKSPLEQELLNEEVPTNFHTPKIQKSRGQTLWSMCKNFKILWVCIQHLTIFSVISSRPVYKEMLTTRTNTTTSTLEWAMADELKPEDMDMSERMGVTLKKYVPLKAIPIPYKGISSAEDSTKAGQ